MGSSESKPDPELLKKQIEKQDQQLEDDREEQKKTLDMLKDTTAAMKGALERVEDMTREQNRLVQQVNEARRRADESRQFAEQRTKELGESMRKLQEDAKKAREERVEAEAEVRRAQEKEREARHALEEAERQLRKGIRPIVVPTQAQHEATKRRLGYQPGFFHFAVAGISGSGKSSLINALRGLRNNDRDTAPTGVVETTSNVVRYPARGTDTPYVWFDVPGAGTLNIPDWQYFTEQGLYIFNCIIVIFDIRFTATDIAILRNCVRFQIPAFIVRSKSGQHIQNIATDLGGGDDDDDDEEEDGEGKLRRMAKARDLYIRDTRASVAQNLEEAGLLVQRVYLVDKNALVKVVKGTRRRSHECIDEEDLLRDLFALADSNGGSQAVEDAS